MNPVFREKRLAATKTDKAHAESGNAVDTAASSTDKPALCITREVQNGTRYVTALDRIAKASNDKALEASAGQDQENVASTSSAAPAASLDSDVAAADVTASPLEPACSSRAIASNVKPVFYSYSAAEAHLPPHLRKITRSSWRSPRERKKATIGHVAPKVNAKKNSKSKAKKAAAPEDKAPNDIPPAMTVILSCGKRTVRTVTLGADEEAIEASDDMGPESEEELEPAVKVGKAVAGAKGKAATAAKSKAANSAKPEAAPAAAKPKATAAGSKAAAAETSKDAATGTSKATPAAKPKKLKVIAVEALKAIPAAKPKARTNTKRARDEDDDDVPQENARPAKARKTAAKPKSTAEPKLTTVAPVAEAPTPLRTDRERGLRRTVKVVDYKTML
ncbi:hypothetical protein EV715DRAFT_205508 [Schizophyllum commune]